MHAVKVLGDVLTMGASLQDAAAHVPMFVFLSPGVDVAAAVEGLGRKLGYTADNGKYVSVSLGQGQEPIAMNHLNNFHRNGGWVLLQNIHLTIDWTSGPLEKKVLSVLCLSSRFARACQPIRNMAFSSAK
jgi:dynein heavy chain, axonemal